MLRNLLDAKWESYLKRFSKPLLVLLRNLMSIRWVSKIFPFIYPLTLDVSRLIEYPFAFKYLRKSREEPVLDIGSGIACFPTFLAKSGLQVVVLDIDKQSIRLQKKCAKELPSMYLDRLSYIMADACTMPFRPLSFSKISCISTIEHIRRDTEAIKEIYRVLKKNGISILTFPYSSVARKALTHPYFMRFYTMDDIRTRLLRTAKFKIVDQYLFGKKLLRLHSRIPGHFTFMIKDLGIGLFINKLENTFLKYDQTAGGCAIVLRRE